MPLPQATRRRLWQANAVLALVALATVTWALTGDHAAIDLPEYDLPAFEARPIDQGTDIPWSEVIALGRHFHGWGGRQAPTEVKPQPTPSDGRLPLTALRLAMWLRDPSGPDGVVLRSKDPARQELHLLEEGGREGDPVVVRIDRSGPVARITVTRGAERFTYEARRRACAGDRRVLLPGSRPRSREAHPGPEARASAAGPGSSLRASLAGLKCVPFFGADGDVAGVRVTGMRPGSTLSAAGLRRGDVILSVDDEPVRSTTALRERLVHGCNTLAAASPESLGDVRVLLPPGR